MSDRIERRLEIEEDREDLRVKIFYDRQALIVYFLNNPTLDVFYARIREACKLTANQPVTVKWIDTEEDPCTISSQLELVEAIRLTTELREAELKVHVFLGLPLNPGAPCPGEDKNVYRRGARRWKKKIYHVNGHRFQPKRLNQRTECALCTDTIWGLGRAGFRCADCGMCVHKKCHKFVSAKCSTSSTWASRMPENSHSSPQLQNGAGSTASSTQASRSVFVAGSPSAGPMQENKIESHQPQRARRNWGTVAPAPPVTAANGHSEKPGLGIDDFELLTVIGRGSYAKVVQAEHKSTGQIYAIKIIKKSLCTDEEDIDWIQTEKSVFETASNHPFLVGLHSCFQTPSRLFFVIEFIPGGDLMFHMQHKQRLPEDHARFYSAEIILALHFLHSRSIIYRDLKLDNVLIDAEGHIKLTDFGMCKEHIGALDLTNTFCGTPNYIAPEILRGEDYGFSVDYWALGVLMFEMMAGRSPFHLPAHEDDQNTEDFLFQIILERQIRIPRHLTVRAANVLKGFLNKDPAERLGCKPDIEEGLNDIKSNNFFKSSIDWELLEQRQIQPPYNPNLAGERDLQRFDTTFTTEEPRLTPDDPTELDKIDQSEFDGFEYINPLIMSREDNV